MTLRTEILAWIMNESRANERELLDLFGEEAKPELASLIELGVIHKVYYRNNGNYYEVLPIWAKPKGNGTGSRR